MAALKELNANSAASKKVWIIYSPNVKLQVKKKYGSEPSSYRGRKPRPN